MSPVSESGGKGGGGESKVIDISELLESVAEKTPGAGVIVKDKPADDRAEEESRQVDTEMKKPEPGPRGYGTAPENVPEVRQWLTEDELKYLWERQGLVHRYNALFSKLRGHGLTYASPTPFLTELFEILNDFLVNKRWAVDPKKVDRPKTRTWW